MPRPRSADRCGFTWIHEIGGGVAMKRTCQRRIGHKPADGHTHGKAKYVATPTPSPSRKE